MIMLCTCKHEYQDKLYGKGKRVFNLCKKGISGRCTVCGREQSSGLKAQDIKVKAK